MKVKYEFVIWGNYGCGWEEVFCDDNESVVKDNFRRYCKEEPQYRHKLTKRRAA